MSATDRPEREYRSAQREGSPGSGPMECRICWHLYDPEEGDPVWQVPAGTPFAELPAHWTCPGCSATKDQFLAVHNG